MGEEAPAMEVRDGAGRPCWEPHLDRSLAARLARRPTVIPTALGDRIWQRIEYFATRARMLAQSLSGRVSPAEQSVNEIPIVHVGWQQPVRSPQPDASSASPVRDIASLPVAPVVKVEATVIEAARRSGIEPTTSPAFAKEPSQLPVVTPAADLTAKAHSKKGSSDAVSTSGQADDHDEHGGRPPIASPGDDSAVTLRMPPGRGRTMIQSPPVHSAPAAAADPPLSRRTVKGRSAPMLHDEAADAMPEVREERPASNDALPGKGRALPAETKLEPAAMEATQRSARGSESGALPTPPEGTELPVVTTQSRERARPSPSDDGLKMIDFVATSTVAGARAVEALGNSPASSAWPGDHASDGVGVASRVPPDGVHAPIRYIPAHAPRQQRGASFDAEETPQTMLPYAGQARVLPSGSAGSPDASQPGAERTGDRSSDPAGLSAPDSPHVPILSTRTDTPREAKPSRHALRALIDIDRLVRQVERRITRRLAIDAERRGGWS